MYVQMKKWAVSWQEELREFDLFYDGVGPVAQHITLQGIAAMDGEAYAPEDYDTVPAPLKNGIQVTFQRDESSG